MKVMLPKGINFTINWDKASYHPAIVPTNVSTVYQPDIRDQIFCGEFCGDVLPLSEAVKEEDSGRLWSFSFTINATAISDPKQVIDDSNIIKVKKYLLLAFDESTIMVAIFFCEIP